MTGLIEPTRRLICQGLAIGAGLGAGLGLMPARAQTQADRHHLKWRPDQTTNKAFITRALALGKQGAQRGDGPPVGAIIVLNGRIIGRAANRVELKHDPTAHAEVEAIRMACHRLGSRALSRAVLYIGGPPPCPMCETASYWASMAEIYHGLTPDQVIRLGAPRYGGC
jgi:tRNA(Arg) A34 adenosine deaminase TadA